MKKVILLLITLLVLAGCEDKKKCIKSHTEMGTCVRYIWFNNGKSMMAVPQYYTCEQTICDEYETIEETV